MTESIGDRIRADLLGGPDLPFRRALSAVLDECDRADVIQGLTDGRKSPTAAVFRGIIARELGIKED